MLNGHLILVLTDLKLKTQLMCLFAVLALMIYLSFLISYIPVQGHRTDYGYLPNDDPL